MESFIPSTCPLQALISIVPSPPIPWKECTSIAKILGRRGKFHYFGVDFFPTTRPLPFINFKRNNGSRRAHDRLNLGTSQQRPSTPHRCDDVEGDKGRPSNYAPSSQSQRSDLQFYLAVFVSIMAITTVYITAIDV